MWLDKSSSFLTFKRVGQTKKSQKRKTAVYGLDKIAHDRKHANLFHQRQLWSTFEDVEVDEQLNEEQSACYGKVLLVWSYIEHRQMYHRK